MQLRNTTALSRAAAQGGAPPAGASGAANSVASTVSTVGRSLFKSVAESGSKIVGAVESALTSSMEVADVVVVGAGPAGLHCAETLLAMNPSLSLMVLEANKLQVGGKTRTEKHTLSGTGRVVAVETGASFIDETHTTLEGLRTRFALATLPQYLCPENELVQNVLLLPAATETAAPKRKLYVGNIHPHSFFTLWEIGSRFVRAVDHMCALVPLEDPASSPRAEKWDAHSVHSYFSKKTWFASTKVTINGFVHWLMGCDASQVSLLQFLHRVKSQSAGRGLKVLLADAGESGVHSKRVVGGVGRVCEKLAETISTYEHARIVLGARVRTIRFKSLDESEHPVMCATTDGRRYLTRLVVLACPVSEMLRGKAGSSVRFSPRLPMPLQTMAARTHGSSCLKVFVVYESAWWRHKMFSGFCANEKPTKRCVVAFCMDHCGMQVDESDAHSHALMCMVSGEMAEFVWGLSKEARRNLILRSLTHFFGEELKARVETPIGYVESSWSVEDVGRTRVFPPGTFRAHHPYDSPLGLSHPKDAQGRPIAFLTSGERSAAFVGTVEGALRSGKDVAKLASKALSEMAQASSARQQAHPVKGSTGGVFRNALEPFQEEPEWPVDAHGDLVLAPGEEDSRMAFCKRGGKLAQ